MKKLFRAIFLDDYADKWPPPWVVDVYKQLRSMAALLREIRMDIAELKRKSDALMASVTAETDISNAVAKVIEDQRAQIGDLKTKLDAAIAANDPAQLQAVADQMDAILALNTSNAQKVAAAVTTNTGTPGTGTGGDDTPIPTPQPDA